MIKIKQKGDFSKTYKFLENATEVNYVFTLSKFGKRGVEALKEATPKLTGTTANSWDYIIEKTQRGTYRLVFVNNNIVDGYANVAILLQYGHATRSGTFVQGRDYINPALKPIFDVLAEDIWKEVTS